MHLSFPPPSVFNFREIQTKNLWCLQCIFSGWMKWVVSLMLFVRHWVRLIPENLIRHLYDGDIAHCKYMMLWNWQESIVREI